MTQFEKYPLVYGEDRCTTFGVAPTKEMAGTPDATVSAQQKQDCLTQLEVERKQHKITDLKNAITFPLLGIILFSLHFPIALKRSKN